MQHFRFSARIGLAASVFVLFVSAIQTPAHAQEKKPPFDELLTFDVRVEPEDPFDQAHARNPNGKWKPRRGQIVRVELNGKLKDGWNTYPITQRTQDQPEAMLTTWEVAKVSGVTPLWPLRESAPKTGKVAGDTIFKYLKSFTWSQDLLVGDDTPVGKIDVPVKLHIQICAGSCFWYDSIVPVKLDISDEPPLPMSPDILERLKTPKPSITVVPVSSARAKDTKPSGGKQGPMIIPEGLIDDSPETYQEKLDAIAKQIELGEGGKGQGGSDLLGFILAGIFWGAISLITPCVFPMIPITVSFFLKQSEKEHHRPVVMASVYSLTIVIVLTLAAAFLLSIFRWLSINPITNYFIGALFIFFALSLFGMYEIELPSSLAQYTSAQEGKGGIYGTVFMALTFTIISFACVAPFLGGFSGTAAAARPLWHNLLGGFAFAATFA